MLESFLKFYVRIVRTAIDLMNISHVYSFVDNDEKAKQRIYSYQFIIEKGFWANALKYFSQVCRYHFLRYTSSMLKNTNLIFAQAPIIFLYIIYVSV